MRGEGRGLRGGRERGEGVRGCDIRKREVERGEGSVNNNERGKERGNRSSRKYDIPDSSLRCRTPKSATRIGSSRYDRILRKRIKEQKRKKKKRKREKEEKK